MSQRPDSITASEWVGMKSCGRGCQLQASMKGQDMDGYVQTSSALGGVSLWPLGTNVVCAISCKAFKVTDESGNKKEHW